MQRGEESGNTAVAENLTSVAFVTFGEFFFELGFAIFERTAQGRGCDEEGEQEDRPLPASNSEDDSASEGSGDGSAFVEAAGFIREECDDDSEEKTKEELHGRVEGQKSKVRDWKSDF